MATPLANRRLFVQVVMCTMLLWSMFGPWIVGVAALRIAALQHPPFTEQPSGELVAEYFGVRWSITPGGMPSTEATSRITAGWPWHCIAAEMSHAPDPPLADGGFRIRPTYAHGDTLASAPVHIIPLACALQCVAWAFALLLLAWIIRKAR